MNTSITDLTTSRNGIASIGLVSVVVLSLLTSPVAPTAADAGFTLDAEAPSTVDPGRSFTVTYTINNTGTTNLSSLGLQATNVSDDLTVTDISSDDATFVSQERNTVGFPAVESGEEITVRFTVQVNATASGDHSLEVEAVNGFGDSRTTRANTTVVTVNTPPTADAGDDRTVPENASVELNATGSTDPDGDTLSYAWAQTAGPPVTLADTASATPNFTVPAVESNRSIAFEVTVTDDHGATDVDNVNLTVEPVNAPPTADAGANQTVDEGGTEVQLDASASTDPDGDTLSFDWNQTAGPDVTLRDADTATPSFAVPNVNATADLTFEVEVADGNGGTATSTVTITVENIPTPPEENQPPTAVAGPNETVEETAAVELNATASSDPDNDTLSYTWTQLGGPNVTLAGAGTASPTFTAPVVAEPAALTFQLKVSDGSASDTDSTTVRVTPTNRAPIADAGPNLTVRPTNLVILDASNSSDPDADSLSYNWTQTSGPSVSLVDASTVTPRLTAPPVEGDRTLTFRLQITDENGSADTDTVSVRVLNDPPTADAGPDRTVNASATVSLDASGSSDLDGDTLAYNWSQVAGPAVSIQDADTATPSFDAPDVSSSTTLTFEVRVTDGKGGSVPDTVDVTVKPATEPNAPPEADAGDDQTVDEGAMVSLVASGSTDPDDDALTYEWRQVAGPDVAIDDPAAAVTPFEAPAVDSRRTLTFALEARDGRGGTDTDRVNVTVRPTADNSPPTADAGNNQTVDENATVVLDGTASGDPDGDALVYQWIQTSGPSVELQDATSATPTFVTPDVSSSTTFGFALEVDDGQATDRATTTVTVEPVVAPARFEVTSLVVPETATPGDAVDVSGIVTNTGDTSGTQSVAIRADADRDDTLETVVTRSLTLDAGENVTYIETVRIPSDVENGTYNATVVTANDSKTATLMIETATELPANLSRDEISQAMYDLNFSELSTETARQVEELYLRQPFAGDAGPTDVMTRDRLARERYGTDFDALNRSQTIAVQQAFDAQFNDTGENAQYTRDEISQAKYDLAFDELSAETAGQVQELYDRQPFADDLTPGEVQTREEIASARYEMRLEELSRETRLEIEQRYDAQFNESSVVDN